MLSRWEETVPRTFFTPQEYARRRGMNIAELPRRIGALIRDGRIETIQVGDEELIPGEEEAMPAAQSPEENRWIPLSEAIAQHPEVDEAVLRKLVKDGVVASKQPPEAEEEWVDGQEVVSVARKLDRRQWDDLEGTGISINAAARKYQLHSPTLLKWARAGHIRILGRDNYRVYLDEADVGFARALYDLAGKPGRALFPNLLDIGEKAL
jgi:hypothetical protein